MRVPGITLRVNAQTAGNLVLSEVYDPDWKAIINDDETDVIAANGTLRAVAIPVGESEIELTHRPISLTVGLAITGITIALVTILPQLLRWDATHPRSRSRHRRSSARRSWLRIPFTIIRDGRKAR